MTCGSCGAPVARALTHCPFCGASTKYALTETGQLPYEFVPGEPRPKENLEPPEPRWDLEGPQGSSHSRWKSMSGISQMWAALERRRRVGKSSLGCFFTGLFFVLIAGSCTAFALLESWSIRQSPAHSLSASEMTATATANPNPYQPYTGLLTLDDQLDDNSAAFWMDYNSDQTQANRGCMFQNGTYDTSKPASSSPGLKYCLADNTNFQNFAYQIEMDNLHGRTGGIIFRQDAPGDFYYFGIGIDSHYSLWLMATHSQKLLSQGATPALSQGNNQINMLAVVANGSIIDLYVNQTHLVTVNDSTYSRGKIGTAVGTPDREATECQYKYAKVWTF